MSYTNNVLYPITLDPDGSQTDLRGSFGGQAGTDPDTYTFGAVTRLSVWMRAWEGLRRAGRPRWRLESCPDS
jgi:hypothetical protein